MALDEISGALKQRLESPVVGTFSISMMLANWKFILILFSDLPYAAKLHEANSYLTSWQFLGAIIAALVATGFILFKVPEIRDYFLAKEIDRESKIIRKKHDSDTIRHLELTVDSDLLKEATKLDEKLDKAKQYMLVVEQLLDGVPAQIPQHLIASGAGDKIGNARQNAAYARDGLVTTLATLGKFKESMIKFQLLQDEAMKRQEAKATK
jgi:hypothetical protein